MHILHCLNSRRPLVEGEALLYKADPAVCARNNNNQPLKEGFKRPWMPAPRLCR